MEMKMEIELKAEGEEKGCTRWLYTEEDEKNEKKKKK